MDTFLGFTIVGVATAAIYAVIGSGLVLTYTTTGVFNFAHGAIGMFAAFAYWQLHLSWGWPLVPSLIVVIGVLAPLVGVGMERLFRGLEATSETTKLVVSISMMLGMIGLAMAIWDPNQGRPFPQFFGANTIDLGVTAISYHQVTMIVVAVVVAVALRFLLYGTRIGVAMRSVVDDRSLSQLTGARTVRVQQLSWITGIVLAAVGGILVAASSGLGAIILSLLIINAYAAAIFGRLRSLPLTFVGALVIGLADGYLQGYLPQNQYLSGLRLAAPVIILFIVLLAIPNPRLRSRVLTREYFPAPSVKGALTFCLVIVLGALVLTTTLSTSDLSVYGKIFPMAVIGLSLVPLLGFANQISLAQFTLAGVGALVYVQLGDGGSPLALLVAVVFTAGVGALIALPALRLSGIYLALATAAFAVAMDRWIFLLPDFEVGPVSVQTFSQGSLRVAPVDLPLVDTTSLEGQVILSAVVLALLVGLVAWIRRNAFGRRLLSIRDSEPACATFGMSIVGTRLAVFSFSAAIAGLGGALFAMQLGSVESTTFDFVAGLPIFVLVAIAGAGFVSSALFMGVITQGVFPFTSVLAPWFTKWQTVLTATSAVGLGIEPSGLGAVWRDRLRNLLAEPAVKWGSLAAMVLVWIFRVVGLYGNWAFLGLLAVVAVAGMALAEVRARRRGDTPAWVRSDRAGPAEAGVPLELVGLVEPWDVTTLAEIDAALGLDELVAEVGGDAIVADSLEPMPTALSVAGGGAP